MIERFAALPRRADEHLQILDDPVLPDILRQLPRPERLLDRSLASQEAALELPGQNAIGR